jgi:hypothetical protein
MRTDIGTTLGHSDKVLSITRGYKKQLKIGVGVVHSFLVSLVRRGEMLLHELEGMVAGGGSAGCVDRHGGGGGTPFAPFAPARGSPEEGAGVSGAGLATIPALPSVSVCSGMRTKLRYKLKLLSLVALLAGSLVGMPVFTATVLVGSALTFVACGGNENEEVAIDLCATEQTAYDEANKEYLDARKYCLQELLPQCSATIFGYSQAYNKHLPRDDSLLSIQTTYEEVLYYANQFNEEQIELAKIASEAAEFALAKDTVQMAFLKSLDDCRESSGK